MRLSCDSPNHAHQFIHTALRRLGTEPTHSKTVESPRTQTAPGRLALSQSRTLTRESDRPPCCPTGCGRPAFNQSVHCKRHDTRLLDNTFSSTHFTKNPCRGPKGLTLNDRPTAGCVSHVFCICMHTNPPCMNVV